MNYIHKNIFNTNNAYRAVVHELFTLNFKWYPCWQPLIERSNYKRLQLSLILAIK
jgi:hypothetical protein